MAHVVMADDGIAFDGATAEAGPLGGAETAFVALAEALAAARPSGRGAQPLPAPLCHNGVRWAPLVGRCSARLRSLHRQSRPPGHRACPPRRSGGCSGCTIRRGYLKKAAQSVAARLRYRPTLVTTGAYHAATVPRWLPCGGREIIPYGVLDRFRARRTARAAAAARGLHLEPAARPRLAARSLDRADRARRCRKPSCTSMPDRRSMAVSRPKASGGWRRCSPAPTALARARRAPLRARSAGEALARGARRRAGHALPRRSRRDLLPRARRGAGDGGAGGRAAAAARVAERVIDGVTGRVAGGRRRLCRRGDRRAARRRAVAALARRARWRSSAG